MLGRPSAGGSLAARSRHRDESSWNIEPVPKDLVTEESSILLWSESLVNLIMCLVRFDSAAQNNGA